MKNNISIYMIAQRNEIERKLSALPKISTDVAKLLSIDGFIDVFLEMAYLYPSQIEAYERLENYYIDVTGRRRYSDYSSFRKVLNRRMKQYKQA